MNVIEEIKDNIEDCCEELNIPINKYLDLDEDSENYYEEFNEFRKLILSSLDKYFNNSDIS